MNTESYTHIHFTRLYLSTCYDPLQILVPCQEQDNFISDHTSRRGISRNFFVIIIRPQALRMLFHIEEAQIFQKGATSRPFEAI